MKLIPLFASLTIAPSLVLASTNGFIVPSFRGSAASQTGYWESFTAPVGAPGNVPDQPGSTTTGILFQSESNAFLTGTGNIYNLEGASRFGLVDTTPFTLGTVIVQTRTIGSELDYATPTLTCSNASGVHVLPPLPRIELDRANVPGLGAMVSSLWQWDVSPLGVSSYEVAFAAAEPSLSFDSLTLDTWDQFVPLFSVPFNVHSSTPAIERWMYPHNAAPCDRAASSTFATFGDESGVDTRHAQNLVGWDTDSLLPAQRGPASYLITRCRVTLTLNRGNLFAYDPTHDRHETYLDAAHPDYIPDEDAGWPVELFGVGFRNDFDASTFDQCADFGSSGVGERNAYAVSWSSHGALVDVGNNVGKTNDALLPFEAVPFAVGQTTNALAGDLVPGGARITFDLNLADPFVLGYLQAGLHEGRLRFMVSSLHTSSGPAGPASYPDFATHFNAAVLDPTRLELEGMVIGNADLDADGLPDDWEIFHLASLAWSADDDPDSDGASNQIEWQAGTNPGSSEDVLRISAEPTGESVATLRWAHRANRSYTVEFTEDWQSWQPVAEPNLVYSAPGFVECVDLPVPGEPVVNRFYRVKVSASAP